MLVFLFILLFENSAHAYTSQDPTWHSLLHYRSSWLSPDKSIIGSPEFFLSPNGSEDPEAELQVTVKAMGQQVSDDPNKHAQCRFPARLQWLRKVAPRESAEWPRVKCTDYLAYSYQEDIESISLVFATGYLSNPASFFGHPMVKFNVSRAKMPSSLLDVAVNYGAVTPANENSFIYAFKGLTGGYIATFSNRDFYYSNHSYGEIDLRDMWEYKLNLKPEEVRFLYAHLWELVGKKFPYYFLSDNCASAVAELLTDAVGVQLMPKNLPYAIPYTLFDNLEDMKRLSGESLVTSITLIPSRQTRLTAGFKNLDLEQRVAVESVAQENRVTDQLKALPPERRAVAVETLFDYYSFRSAGMDKQTADSTYGSVKRELLVDRLQLPQAKQSETREYQSKPPHAGPRPFLTRIGGIKSTKFGDGVELQVRPALYDILSLDFGRSKNSEVRVLDFSIDFVDDVVWIRKVDLVSVATLNLSQTGLPGDGGWAWEFTTGFDSLHLGCRSCSIFKVEAGYGKAFAFLGRQAIYAMVNGRAQTETEDSGHLAATPRLGTLINWLRSGILATEFSVGYRSYLEENKADGAVIKTETRLSLGRNSEIRIAYDKHVEELSRVSVAHYW